jgi:hypothetical protein
MKALLWVGVLLLVLGIASLFVAIPHKETHGIKAGDVNIGVQTETSETLPRGVSVALIVGGLVLAVIGGTRRA